MTLAIKKVSASDPNFDIGGQSGLEILPAGDMGGAIHRDSHVLVWAIH